MRLKPKIWDAQQTELAERLIAEKAPDAICIAMLGRTRQACFDHIRRNRDSFGNMEKSGFCVEAKLKIPPEVIAERNERLMAYRDITASLMGDPEPGRAKL